MPMRYFAAAAMALATVGLASPGHASGSGAGGGSLGIPDIGGAGAANSREARELQRLFRRGRSQVRKHITCKQCDFHKKLNKNTALEVAQNLLNGQYEIEQEDQTAVLIYLRDRYDL